LKNACWRVHISHKQAVGQNITGRSLLDFASKILYSRHVEMVGRKLRLLLAYAT
jgi:hypothetical protein